MAEEHVQLRTYAFIDSMQPQFAAAESAGAEHHVEHCAQCQAELKLLISALREAMPAPEPTEGEASATSVNPPARPKRVAKPAAKKATPKGKAATKKAKPAAKKTVSKGKAKAKPAAKKATPKGKA